MQTLKSLAVISLLPPRSTVTGNQTRKQYWLVSTHCSLHSKGDKIHALLHVRAILQWFVGCSGKKKKSLQQPLVLGDKFSSISKPPNYLDIKLFETPVLWKSSYPPIGCTDKKKLKRHENTLHVCFFNLLETRLF